MVHIEIVPYDPRWTEGFIKIGSSLRAHLRDQALAIHHIGSTSIPGLGAKPVIDVQVTVAELEPVESLLAAVGRAALDWVPDCVDARKLLFHRRGAGLDVNCHVRRVDCPSRAQALLFRDYLRASATARQIYEAAKRSLAEHAWPSVDDYAEAKGDVVWRLLREADAWSWYGWRPGPTEA